MVLSPSAHSYFSPALSPRQSGEGLAALTATQSSLRSRRADSRSKQWISPKAYLWISRFSQVIHLSSLVAHRVQRITGQAYHASFVPFSISLEGLPAAAATGLDSSLGAIMANFLAYEEPSSE